MKYKRFFSYLLGAIMPFVGFGQSIMSAIGEIEKEYAPDKRQVVYELSVVAPTDAEGDTIVTGKISEAVAHDALMSLLNEKGCNVVDSITVFPYDKWAQVRISVACLRCGPSHAAEMASQGIMGMPLRLLEKDDDGWWRVQTPDGYISYVTSGSLVEKSAEQMDAWRNDKDRVIVSALWQTHVFSVPNSTNVKDVVTDVVNGNILQGHYDSSLDFIKVVMPDGREGYIKTTDVTDIADWASQSFDAEKIMEIAYSMMGTPYLWGGTSIKSLDCSGFSKVSYFANGIILMRDASQQAKTGLIIPADEWRSCQTGDLLFFGNAETHRVTHVAIYDHDGLYVHSSGRVRRNSLDPDSPDYLSTPFLHASRINGNLGTTGIIKAENHPWYFNLENK